MMNIGKLIIKTTLAWLLLTGIPALASVTTAQPKLTVTPDTCVVMEEASPCHTELTILATGLKPTNYCIYQATQKLPLVCSLSNERIEHVLRVSTAGDIDFKLIEMSTDTTVIKTKLTVGLFQPAQYRKRRRYGWGLI